MIEPVPKPLALRGNATWTLFSNATFALSQWVLLILMAKFLSAEAVGRFALALALSAPVTLLTNMQLRAVLGADAARVVPLAAYLRARLVAVVGTVATLSLMAAFWPFRTAQVILLVAGMKAVESGIDILHGLFQSIERMDIMARSRLLRAAGSVAGMALGLTLTHSLTVGLSLVLLSWLTVLLAYDRPRFRKWKHLHNASSERPKGKGELLKLIGRAFPLGAAAALGSLCASVPRLVLEHYRDEQELGLYAALAYLVVVGALVTDSVSEAALPRLARHYRDDPPRFQRLLSRLVAFGAAVGIVGVMVSVLFGAEVLRLLYGAEYVREDVLIWVMVAAGLGYIASPVNFALVAADRFGAQLFVVAGVVVVVSVASLLLVPAAGSLGASQAAAAAAAFQVLLAGVVISGVVRRRRGRASQQVDPSDATRSSAN